MREREYGQAGRFGIGTPQANPTVEAELGILMPRDATLHTIRLTSTAIDPADRLREYLERLPELLASYDTFLPDAFGFACTGSSYLIGAEREAKLVRAASTRLRAPVLTAAQAIGAALERLNLRRIAIVAPYPVELLDAARRYWRDAGFQVTRIERVQTGSADTRSIYDLRSDDARIPLQFAFKDEPEAVLLSGTGMPSLAILAEQHATGPVLLSSNFALASALLRCVGREDRLEDARIDAPAGWRQRFSEAISAG